MEHNFVEQKRLKINVDCANAHDCVISGNHTKIKLLNCVWIIPIDGVPSRAGQQCVRVRGRAVRVGLRRRALRMRGPPRACAR